MFLFRKSQKTPQGSSSQDEKAARIVHKILTGQEAVARFLNQCFSTLSTLQKKVVFGLFCLCFGGASVFLIVRSLTAKFTAAYDDQENFQLQNTGGIDSLFEKPDTATRIKKPNSKQ